MKTKLIRFRVSRYTARIVYEKTGEEVIEAKVPADYNETECRKHAENTVAHEGHGGVLKEYVNTTYLEEML